MDTQTSTFDGPDTLSVRRTDVPFVATLLPKEPTVRHCFFVSVLEHKLSQGNFLKRHQIQNSGGRIISMKMNQNIHSEY